MRGPQLCEPRSSSMKGLNYSYQNNSRFVSRVTHQIVGFCSLFCPQSVSLKDLWESLRAFEKEWIIVEISTFVSANPCNIKARSTFAASLSFWRRTWDSNPRGCYTLLAFQASSLATRSILRVQLINSCRFLAGTHIL